MLNLIRLVSSTLLLCSFVYLVVDLGFRVVALSELGEWPYWTTEAVFQGLIGLSLYKGWIVIYSGRVLPVGTNLPLV